jgi:4-deoxy-L-threo-5-hexosulose-uronate ketol-isomerase
MEKMETRYAHAPHDITTYTTEALRAAFLIEEVFVRGAIRLTYTHDDRMIFGGIMPTTEPLEVSIAQELGVAYFLERRELGVINIGGAGVITVDGQRETMEQGDGYYIGQQTRDVIFESVDAMQPAKFYVASSPAHHKYPNVKISQSRLTPVALGGRETMNARKIYQYIHPNVCQSAQLQMGYTQLAPGSGWNTMPAHTHERRMETYVYFDVPADNKVFHFLGQPSESRHLVVGNEQAVISPSWSMHTGSGTSHYSFIWSMCGENITYDDMDIVAMDDLR